MAYHIQNEKRNSCFFQTQGQIHDTVSDVFTKTSTLEDRVNKIENTLVSLQVSTCYQPPEYSY